MVGGRQFWLPNKAEVMNAAGDIYFAPLSRLVMNVETIAAAADVIAPPAVKYWWAAMDSNHFRVAAGGC